MVKLASEEVVRVLSEVPKALRAQKAENAQLREKVAEFEKRERVTKLANEMHEKRLDPETTLEEKVERLMAHKNLDAVEEAVRLSAPQIKLGSLVPDRPGNALDPRSPLIEILTQ